ncbi:MAG: serine/threonine-protein kinase [Polyangiaceae bacterium]
MEGFVALAPSAVFAKDFRVVRPLSSGGMGAVYIVEQLSTGKRRALKLMRPELVENPDLRARFEREARIGAQIDSDHVVEVIGAGVDDASKLPWLAMELLAGEAVSDYLARTGPASVGLTAEIAEQLAHALAAAHEKGIVHRDLKPENVFLAKPRRTGAPFTVKVLDFGIAKVLADAKTKTTGALGTPLWMAPEQTSPGADITPQADVWAFGLFVFWLLTGKSYWRSANVGECSPVVLLREIVMDPLAPASERAKELGRPALPKGFDAWFARAVARDPSARFADAGDAHAALASVLGEPPPLSVELRVKDERASRASPTEVGEPAAPQFGPGETELALGTLPPPSGAALARTAAQPASLPPPPPPRVDAPMARGTNRTVAIVAAAIAVTAISVVSILAAVRAPTPPPTTSASPPVASSSAPQRETGIHVSGQRNLMVYVDGKTAGTTPLTLTTLTAGKHHLRFDAGEDYAPKELDVDLEEGQILSLPDVNLKVLRGHLTIEQVTKGISAEIQEVDGLIVLAREAIPAGGVITRDLDATKRWRVVGTKAGYDDQREDVVFRDGDANQLIKLSLFFINEADPKLLDRSPETARVNFNSNPWSNVALDGVQLGATPLSRIQVAPGKHTAVLTSRSEGARTVSFDVKVGEIKSIVVRFDEPAPTK